MKNTYVVVIRSVGKDSIYTRPFKFQVRTGKTAVLEVEEYIQALEFGMPEYTHTSECIMLLDHIEDMHEDMDEFTSNSYPL